jgi:nicotinamidase-related amidase
MKKLKIHLVIIDPQNDFMDLPKSKLPVSGANADMNRLAEFVRTNGSKLSDIHVTLDSHQQVHIANPIWWVNPVTGKNPDPFTQVTSSDITAGIWTTRDPNPKTRKRCFDYVEALEKNKKKVLTIWNPHCQIGTWGHSVQENLSDALADWQVNRFKEIDFVTKGSNPWTEHYGALMAEVPDSDDDTTSLNSKFIEVLATADIILIAGEALSHCVMETLNQIVDNIGDEHIKKIQILTDATSSIGHYAPGPDFPAISKLWLEDMKSRGVQTTTTDMFFSQTQTN